jgi:hypothetical protein
MGPLWGNLAWLANFEEADADEAQDGGGEEPWSGVFGALAYREGLAFEGGQRGQGPCSQAP